MHEASPTDIKVSKATVEEALQSEALHRLAGYLNISRRIIHGISTHHGLNGPMGCRKCVHSAEISAIHWAVYLTCRNEGAHRKLCMPREVPTTWICVERKCPARPEFLRVIVVLVRSLTMLLSTAARSVSAAPGRGRRAASAIASKYAKAAFGAALAKSPQTLTKVHSELVNISNTVKKDPDVATFVTNPTLSLQERKKALQTLFTKLEGTGAKKEQVSDVTKNLLNVLAENGRLAETEGVIEAFNESVAQYKGELTVTITSASPLPKDVLTRLESTLKQSQTAQAAKTLKVENKVRLSSHSLYTCAHLLQSGQQLHPWWPNRRLR